jgi:voltage-gated potassium channel
MESHFKIHDQQYLRSPLIKERFKLRNKIERIANIPFAILGFIWFNLLILSLIYAEDSYSFLRGASSIWILFQVELMIKIFLSPSAFFYCRKNPLSAVSAIIPVVRVAYLYRYTIFFRQPVEKL